MGDGFGLLGSEGMNGQSVLDCGKELEIDKLCELSGLERDGRQSVKEGFDFIEDKGLSERGVVMAEEVDAEVFVEGGGSA